MRKSIIILITVSLILSGCVDRETSVKNDNATSIDDVSKENISNDTIDKIADKISNNTSSGVNMEDKANGDKFNVAKNTDPNTPGMPVSNWCVSGSKINVRGEEFTIVGTAVIKERQVCQAEIVRNNGKTTRYYSEDGSFESVTSTSSGHGANSSAVSIVNVNKS